MHSLEWLFQTLSYLHKHLLIINVFICIGEKTALKHGKLDTYNTAHVNMLALIYNRIFTLRLKLP